MEYKRSLQKFASLGVELNAPVNLMPPGKYPVLKNVRAYQGGRLEARKGFVKVNSSAIADVGIHTVARVNDYLTLGFMRFIGAADKLYGGQTSQTLIDSGFSGEPLSIVPYHSDQAISGSSDLAYIFGAGKSLKVAPFGLQKYKVGAKPPVTIASADLKNESLAYAYAPAVELGWVSDGIAGPTTFEQLLAGVSVGFDHPDGEGWTSINPSGGNSWDISPYDVLWINGNTVVAEEIHYLPSPTTTAVELIADADGSGIATVQPVINIQGMRRNSLVQVGSTLTRVLSIMADINQINSFRAVCSGFAGVGITAPIRTVRLPDYGFSGGIEKHAIGATWTGPGSGTITTIKGSPGYNLGNVNGRTLGPNDYITFGVYASDLTRFSSIRVLLDIDQNTTSATPTNQIGVKNALYKDLSPADFDGSYAWKTFRIRISELVRIGGDASCGLNDTRAVQIQVTTPADSKPADTVQVKLGFIYTSGSFGPDTATNLTPYLYRYRYRSSFTGARSNPGPAMYTGITAQRQQIKIIPADSADSQIDKIDIERFGGNNLEWHYVGTVPNTPGVFFLDGFSDSEILVNPALETNLFETFPVVQAPYAASVSVAGTAVKLYAGNAFDPDWARGTEVIINGFRTTLAASPSTDTLQLVDSAGGIAGSPTNSAGLEIPEPLKVAVSVEAVWGPFYECLMGVGDGRNPGRLYFTNGADPDSSADINYIDITSPTETLMNGCLFNGRNYVISDKRMFSILPINNPNEPTQQFQYTEVPTSRGLFSRWALAVGPSIWYLGPDGIYESDGGAPVLITQDIQPLFPQGETPGFAVRGINPVNMSGPLRLCYHNGYLYFDYTDSSNAPRTLVYDIVDKAWYPDINFEDTLTRAITCRFSEFGLVSGDEIEVATLLCGSNAGYMYTTGGNSDDGGNIYGRVHPPALDLGDSRAKKVYGDIVYELNTNGVTLTFTPYLNNYEDPQSPSTYSNTQQKLTDPQDLSNGIGVFGRNIGVAITWNSTTAAPELYSWEPSYLERPEDTFLRADDWTDGGFAGSKFITGFLVQADTENVPKTVELEMDQGFVQSYTMQHNGQTTKVYTVKPQAIGRLVRLRPTDALAWREFQVSYIYDKYPELSDLVTPYVDGGYQGAKLLRGFDLEAMGGPANIVVEYDGGAAGPTVPVDHSGITALHTKPYSFRPPFIATEVRLNPQSAIRLGRVKWIFDPYPDLSPLITPYDIAGYNGAKFVQGIKLEAAGNTTLAVDYDGDQVATTFVANHTDSDGVGVLLTKAYSFQTPFIAHELRLRTFSSSSGIRLGKMEWVFEPAPELVLNWVSQGTSHGIPGYQFIKDGYIAHQSTADITLSVILEGVGEVYTFTIPNSGGVYKKTYVLLGTGLSRTLKDKLFKYRLDSSQPFRLFKRDCEIRVCPWSEVVSPLSVGGYRVFRPFGDVEGEDGARI